ncbi:MAG: YXWGXW repeat-containing protein [Deltaproteobacteria bacterium]|nr:YXWGXW repeat-containing protein [Deltaproteobacteria bacterium]MCW5806128.1 YXWGXW repeat-containing protein [Deltaproteobacteria bacterium]
MMRILGTLVFATIAAGCVVETRGSAHVHATSNVVVEVEEAPPPPRQIVTEVRPGFVFIQGRHERRGRSWVWVEGRWERERANHHYVQGRWVQRGKRHVWVEGHWDRRGDVRDHRDHRGHSPGPVQRR